jgi:hypothetical protein
LANERSKKRKAGFELGSTDNGKEIRFGKEALPKLKLLSNFLFTQINRIKIRLLVRHIVNCLIIEIEQKRFLAEKYQPVFVFVAPYTLDRGPRSPKQLCLERE